MKTKSKIYGIDVESVLDKTLPDFLPQSKESLRKTLVVLNEEANKRLKGWSRAGKDLREELQIKEMKQRLGVRKGEYTPYKTHRGMSKKDIIRDIEKRVGLLNKITSDVEGGRKIKALKNARLVDKLSLAGYDYYDIKTAKPTLKKIGKILSRLRDDRFISATAQTGGSSLGSPTIFRDTFQIMMDNPYMGVDALYEKILKKLRDETADQAIRKRIKEKLLKMGSTKEEDDEDAPF